MDPQCIHYHGHALLYLYDLQCIFGSHTSTIVGMGKLVRAILIYCWHFPYMPNPNLIFAAPLIPMHALYNIFWP